MALYRVTFTETILCEVVVEAGAAEQACRLVVDGEYDPRWKTEIENSPVKIKDAVHIGE